MASRMVDSGTLISYKEARGRRLEFGDFQTPTELASTVVRHVYEQGFRPRSVLEPTCGRGSILRAALAQFPELERAVGVDRNADYLSELRALTASDKRVNLIEADCFTFNWRELTASLPQPLLIVGNPPWVTSSRLGTLESENAPLRDSSVVRRGMDALTGKSNFDVSEWLLLKWIDAMQGLDGQLVMLVKSSVARRIMIHLVGGQLGAAAHPIDAKKYFGADVSACLLEVHAGIPKLATHKGLLISNQPLFERWKNLASTEPMGWRSGIKHDAAKVLELTPLGEGNYRNGLGETVELESTHLYPLQKSSDLSRPALSPPRRMLLVSQLKANGSTANIEQESPRTWAYLDAHGHILDARASIVYKRAPRFAIFGVGPYTFSPWKVATSCLHKNLRFHAVGPVDGKPVVFDDASALLSFESQIEAEHAARLFNSTPAKEFWESMVFWDAKRPLTIELLRTLSLQQLRELKEE